MFRESKREIFLILLLFLITIVSRTLMMILGVSSPFAFSNLGNSIKITQTNHFALHPFHPPGDINMNANFRSYMIIPNMFLAITSVVTGMHFDTILFLPIPGIIIPFLGYVLLKKFKAGAWWAFGCGLFLALDPGLSYLTYNSDIHGWGVLFYLLFLIVLVRSIRHPVRWRERVLIPFFAILALFSYYTAGSHALVFLFLLLIAAILKVGRLSIKHPLILFLPVAVVIGFFVILGPPHFISLILKTITFRFPNPLIAVTNSLKEGLSLFLGEKKQATQFATYPQVALVSGVLLSLILLLSVWVIGVIIRSIIRKGKGMLPSGQLLTIILLFVAVLHILMYIFYGGIINIFLIFLNFPLALFIFFSSKSDKTDFSRTYKRIGVLFLVFCLILAFFKFPLFYEYKWSQGEDVVREELQETNDVVNLVDGEVTFLSDLTAAELAFYSSVTLGGEVHSYIFYTEESVRFLYSENATEEFVDFYGNFLELPCYMLVTENMLHSYYTGKEWMNYPPVRSTKYIDKNKVFNKIYHGGKIRVYYVKSV